MDEALSARLEYIEAALERLTDLLVGQRTDTVEAPTGAVGEELANPHIVTVPQVVSNGEVTVEMTAGVPYSPAPAIRPAGVDMPIPHSFDERQFERSFQREFLDRMNAAGMNQRTRPVTFPPLDAD